MDLVQTEVDVQVHVLACLMSAFAVPHTSLCACFQMDAHDTPALIKIIEITRVYNDNNKIN